MPVKIHKDTAACAATGTMANANNGVSTHQPTIEEELKELIGVILPYREQAEVLLLRREFRREFIAIITD